MKLYLVAPRMMKEVPSNPFLEAFPPELRSFSEKIARQLDFSKHKYNERGSFFEVVLSGITLRIPERIYLEESDRESLNVSDLTLDEAVVLACMFSRHADGHVRERSAKFIIRSKKAWAIPYILVLMGEYVPEISQDIVDNISRLDKATLTIFLNENPGFFERIQRRLISYWNEYYRYVPLDSYAPYRALMAISEMTDTPLSRKVFKR